MVYPFERKLPHGCWMTWKDCACILYAKWSEQTGASVYFGLCTRYKRRRLNYSWYIFFKFTKRWTLIIIFIIHYHSILSPIARIFVCVLAFKQTLLNQIHVICRHCFLPFPRCLQRGNWESLPGRTKICRLMKKPFVHMQWRSQRGVDDAPPPYVWKPQLNAQCS